MEPACAEGLLRAGAAVLAAVLGRRPRQALPPGCPSQGCDEEELLGEAGGEGGCRMGLGKPGRGAIPGLRGSEGTPPSPLPQAAGALGSVRPAPGQGGARFRPPWAARLRTRGGAGGRGQIGMWARLTLLQAVQRPVPKLSHQGSRPAATGRKVCI